MDPCWESMQQHPGTQTLSSLSVLSAMDGEADPETLAYLQTHPQCAAEITRLRWLQNLLRTRLFRLFCPSTDMLIDHYFGLLDCDQHITIGDHLKICPHCAAEFVMLTRTPTGLESDKS